MARLRINLGLSPANKAELENLVAPLTPNHDAILDAIESGDTGKINTIIANSRLGDSDKQRILAGINQFSSTLPDRASTYRGYADKIKDEANATDEELQNKQEAYKGLSNSGEPIDMASVQNQIKSLLVSARIPEGRVGGPEGPGVTRDELEKILPKFITSARRLPDIGELRDLLVQNGVSAANAQGALGNGALQNFLNDQNAKNFVGKNLGGQPADFTEDIKRIQGILDTRAEEGRKTGAVNEYLQTAPKELAQSRADFYKTSQGANTQFLRTRFAPRAVEELNTRGLAEGPDVASVVAAKGSELQGTLEGKIRELETNSNAFFADAAYRITQAKLDMKEDALREQINFERQQGRQKQEADFRQKEQDIQSEFEKSLLQKEQDRNLALTNEGLNSDASAQNDVELANLAGETGQAAGQIVGTKLATKGAPSAAPSLTKIG